MLWGPTVRRLHRERHNGRIARARRSTRPTRTGLPFSTVSLLGLDQAGAHVLVLDGKAVQFSECSPRRGEAQVLVNGCPKAVRRCESLKGLLAEALTQHRRAVFNWAQQAHRGTSRLDGNLPALSPRTAEAIGQFVRERLIPRLQAEGGAVPVSPPIPATAPVPGRFPEAAMQSFLEAQVWPRWFAFHRDTWHCLTPFFGQPLAGRLHLEWEGQAFISMAQERRRLALLRCDQRLEEAVSRSLQALEQQQAQPQALYQGGAYAVLCSPRRHYFCCRQLPPYVVEGQDRALYLFGGVQVGVPIIDLEVSEVIRPFSALVMHAYRHMFAHSAGGTRLICMLQPADYYQRLHQLPLEEALLQYLEAARMTLCAGYHEGNRAALLHDIRRLGKPQISLREAQAQGLPVYRFYRR